MSNSRLILKNTVFLYCRQILVLFIALFTTRIVINVLGIDDYGLYNLIAGVIMILTIITGSMTSSTQRFLSISLGKNGQEEFIRIYNVCFTLFVLLSGVVLLFGETIGLWFINTQLSIPDDRIVAANWCYQTALFTFILRMLRIPSNAAIIAHEKMNFYAYVSILDVLLQLGVAYALYIIAYDHLITYSLLLTLTAVISNLIYGLYSKYKLGAYCRGFSLEKKYFQSIFSFSFWIFFGSISTIGTRQAIDILINRFFGIRLNASTAVAAKLGGNAYDFVANFTTAYRPQILKLYSAGRTDELYNMIYRTTKLSMYLFLIIMIPLNLNLDLLLDLWLGIVPEYAATFCRLLMIYLLIDAMQSPLWVLVIAIGNIKRFQVVFSCMNILNIPVMWLLLNYLNSPESIYYCYIAFNVLTSAYRLYYLKSRSEISFSKYFSQLFRMIITAIIAYTLCSLSLSTITLSETWLSLLSNVAVVIIISLAVIITIGLNQAERAFAYRIIQSKLHL